MAYDFQNSSSQPEGQTLDLSACEREPIHIPGSVQSHGVVLLLSLPELEILQVSTSVAEICGLAPEALLGRPLDALLDEPSLERIQSRTDDPLTQPVLLFPLRLRNGSGSTLEGAIHRLEGDLLLELQPQPVLPESLGELFRLTQEGVQLLEGAHSVPELCRVSAVFFRKLTGYDRVLVYQFDEEWNGAVVSEEQDGGFESYLGLHFPASDIPAQARALYHSNHLRLIADRDRPPSPVLPGLHPVTGAPLDLSLSMLRGVSPVHLEYLRNMGIAGAMSIALTVGDQLWGLLSCHHRSPRPLSFEVLAACRFLGRIASQRLTVLTWQEENAYRSRLRRLQAQFVEFMAQDPLQGELSSYGEHLLDFLNAEGFVMIADDGMTSVGNTPPSSIVEQLQEWLGTAVEDEIFYTDQLAALFPPARDHQDCASGMLAFPILRLPRAYAIWFRPERVRTISWGGDPRKPVEPVPEGEHGVLRLHPRKSFELFKETVRGRSAGWKKAEIEAAIELRSLITGVILLVRKAKELSRANDMLQHTVRELDQFAYITSHDLKAPLRGISSLSKWIEEDLGQDITPETRRHLELMRGRVCRMEEMISGILAYSRIGRVKVEVETVDTGRLLAEIADLLAPPPGFRVEIARDMPTLTAEKMRLQQVLMNLISNAIKHHGGSSGCVEVGATDLGKFYEFAVRDDGQGIDPRYHDRIFGMFQTLQSRDKVEGTGIGLALVKKIVDSQGGTITVESEAGAGTTFRFTWPKFPLVTRSAIAPPVPDFLAQEPGAKSGKS